MKYYFAYGTLLDIPSMQSFAPSARPLGVMRLDGYEPTFAETNRPGKGGCSLVARPGAVTYGVQYEMSDEDMDLMDEGSGVPDRLWVHLPITVTDAEGRSHESVTYTVPDAPPAFRPNADYVGKILAGLDALEMPADYDTWYRSLIAERRAD